MGTNYSKELRKIEKALTAQGWTVRDTTSGKQYLAPDGVGIVSVHKTPSDHRALANIKGELRRRGAKL